MRQPCEWGMKSMEMIIIQLAQTLESISAAKPGDFLFSRKFPNFMSNDMRSISSIFHKALAIDEA